MASRNLSLTERREDVREKQPVSPVIAFTLEEIKSHFECTIDSIEKQFEIADSLANQGKQEACEDIWRSQIVYIESALDFYMHEISKYITTQMHQNNWRRTSGYNRIQVTLEDVEVGLKEPESSTWFVTLMNKHFSWSVFLAYDTISSQLKILGINLKDVLKEAFPKPAENDVQYRSGEAIINELFKRRNQIAHQCDRKHENAEKDGITKEYVEQAIRDINAFINVLHRHITEKDTTE